jgi:tungstate transport system substrate-binding protein
MSGRIQILFILIVALSSGCLMETSVQENDGTMILVHSPVDEERFVAEGYGKERRCVMYNDFVIVGPVEGPARIANIPVITALKTISATGSTFISRGDNSGTHKKELELWELAMIEAKGDWYIETGTGMGQTLLTASEKKGYTLTDRGTFISMGDRFELAVLISGDRRLLNPYSIILVNPIGELLVQWITSDEGQTLIGNFTKNSEQLFMPLHNKCLED